MEGPILVWRHLGRTADGIDGIGHCCCRGLTLDQKCHKSNFGNPGIFSCIEKLIRGRRDPHWSGVPWVRLLMELVELAIVVGGRGRFSRILEIYHKSHFRNPGIFSCIENYGRHEANKGTEGPT